MSELPDVRVLRWLYENQVESAHPVVVLEDTDEAIAVFEAGGSTVMHTQRERSGPRARNLARGAAHAGYREGVWFGNGVVRVHRPSQPWSVWRWIDERGQWVGDWYINLEQPWRRTTLGFDTEDWILDVVADPDFVVRLKDEDEFEWAERTSRFDAEQIARVREAARDAVAAVEQRAWPFDADWTRWLPRLDAAPPALLEGWDAS